MNFTAPYKFITGGDLSLHLHGDHLADLRASGLTEESIRAAGVHSIRPCNLEHFFRQVPFEIGTALCFPYQGGQFARIKLFPALGKMKYAQPPKTGARYMPCSPSPGALVVTEGEKKTLAAHQAGFNAVGIGGVWQWLSSGEPIGGFEID